MDLTVRHSPHPRLTRPRGACEPAVVVDPAAGHDVEELVFARSRRVRIVERVDHAEILRLLKRGESIAEISRALNVAYKTVANNCSAMKRKLGVSSMAELDGREAKVLDASEV
jgi:Bacterial regulatory proteins, luxR family